MKYHDRLRERSSSHFINVILVPNNGIDGESAKNKSMVSNEHDASMVPGESEARAMN